MASTILKNIENYSKLFEKISCNLDESFTLRLSKLEKEFQIHFGSTKNARYFSSPGRIEICGNHTDHQNGKVLSGAVNLDTIACVQQNNDNEIRILSDGYPMMRINLADLKINQSQFGTSTALVRGVAAHFANNGKNIGGFNATCHSTVARGAGISSSASFELLIACILNELYNGGTLDPTFLAEAAHTAESVFFGKPCGLLDQCAIAYGGIAYIDFELGYPQAQTLQCDLPLSVILINTGGDHSGLTDEYAAIRQEMNQVAAYFGKKVLREVSDSEFYCALPNLRKCLSGRAILRAMHFFTENQRVTSAVNALNNNDTLTFADIINKSGESSLVYLQNCYPSGDTKQLIPSAVEIMKTIDGVLAARVHGGGFAGTVIAFAQTDKLDKIIPIVQNTFGKDNYFVVNIRHAGATEITKEIFSELNK